MDIWRIAITFPSLADAFLGGCIVVVVVGLFFLLVGRLPFTG